MLRPHNMIDSKLARTFREEEHEAEAKGVDPDSDTYYYTLDEILYRAGVPLDESAQGLTELAWRVVDAWCDEALR